LKFLLLFSEGAFISLVYGGKSMSNPPAPGTRFPFINLEKSILRADALFKADPKGRPMSVAAAFSVWAYSEKSSGGFQTIAALKMYGLLKAYKGQEGSKIGLTEEALRFFRDEREEEKQKLAQAFALRPRLIAALWQDWRATPPADAIARSHLKADRGLADQAARSLLAIYKENLAFANIKGDAMVSLVEQDDDEGDGEATAPADSSAHTGTAVNKPLLAVVPPPPPPGKAKLMDGERELTAGLLAKDTGFRLIVRGHVGVKEIEMLIKKLEIDKGILAESQDEAEQ
jgi:hypothetical protein